MSFSNYPVSWVGLRLTRPQDHHSITTFHFVFGRERVKIQSGNEDVFSDAILSSTRGSWLRKAIIFNLIINFIKLCFYQKSTTSIPRSKTLVYLISLVISLHLKSYLLKKSYKCFLCLSIMSKRTYISFSTSCPTTDSFMCQKGLKFPNVNKTNHFIKGNLRESLILLLQILDIFKYTDKNESMSSFVQHARSWTKKTWGFFFVCFFRIKNIYISGPKAQIQTPPSPIHTYMFLTLNFQPQWYF